jgi:3-methylfumaryl-CoA hydratase
MSQTQPRVQTRIDPLDPDRARALQATLGDAPSIRMGDPIPPFAHHIYFWDPQPPQDLGRDGHPATGQFIPDTGLPRRMWAAASWCFIRHCLPVFAPRRRLQSKV